MRPTVVVRFSSLGDVVLAGSVTGPLGPVTFLTLPRYAEVAAALPGVERVVCWGEPLPRAGRVIDLHASPRSRWACLQMLGRTRRVARHDLRRRLRVAFKMAPAPLVIERYARAAGVQPAAEPWIRVEGPADALLLAPGAAHATKCWPVDRFAELGRRWEGPVVVLGGPGEQRLVDEVVAGVGSRAEGICETGFSATLAALGRGGVGVATDTGLLHLMGAAGVPVVGLFGPTTSADGFWCHAGRTAEVPLYCRPCSRHGGPGCPIGDHLCMEALGADEVWEAVAATRADRIARREPARDTMRP